MIPKEKIVFPTLHIIMGVYATLRMSRKKARFHPESGLLFLPITHHKRSAMRNFTIQVTDEVYRYARVAAANRSMSVSALFRAFILALEKEPRPDQHDHEKFLKMFPSLPHSYLQERMAEKAEEMAEDYYNEHHYVLEHD